MKKSRTHLGVALRLVVVAGIRCEPLGVVFDAQDILALQRLSSHQIVVSGFKQDIHESEGNETRFNLVGVRLFCVGGPEGSRRGCERHGKSYLTRRRRGEEGDGAAR